MTETKKVNLELEIDTSTVDFHCAPINFLNLRSLTRDLHGSSIVQKIY